MRWICAGLLFLFLATGCKKTVDKAAENALMEIITNGQWKVTSFTKGSNNITPDFSVYLFQFKRDGTVDAIKAGTVEKTGTWEGNAVNKSIVSSFSNATEPLILLNGTWSITKTSLTFVESNQTVSGEERFLRLDKQ